MYPVVITDKNDDHVLHIADLIWRIAILSRVITNSYQIKESLAMRFYLPSWHKNTRPKTKRSAFLSLYNIKEGISYRTH